MFKKYSNFKKAVAVIVQLVCMVALVVSVYVLMSSFDRNMFKDGKLAEADYFASDYFRKDATKEIKRLLYYIQLRNNFETKGVYDPEKIVDIKDYIDRDYISGDINTGVSYILQDLIEWGKKGITKEEVTVKDNAGTETVIKDALVEEVPTADGDTLKAKYQQGYFRSVEDFTYIMNYIERAIKALPDDINKYKEENTKFKVDNTNIRYLVISGGFYTNMEFEDRSMREEELKNIIKDQGVYLYINSSTFGFESSFSDIESEMYRYIDSLKTYDSYGYQVYLYIDKNLPAADSLRTSYENYQNLRPWFWTCVVIGLLSIAGLIISLTYITLTSGYRDTRKAVYLNSFDRLYTELMLFLLVFLGGVVAYITMDYYINKFSEGDTVRNLLVLGGVALVGDLLLISGYLSILRRRRAGTLKTNSLYHAITTPVKTAMGTRVITVRVVVRYALTVIVCLLLGYLGFYRKQLIALIALGLFLVYVGVVLIRESFLTKRIIDGASRIADGDLDYKIDLTGLSSDNLFIGELINNAGEGMSRAVNEQIKSEKLKADLITNVSHDIKTPLTSIINYVELLKREDISDPKIQGYIGVLEEKSQRLKHLTEDLVEASKISSGNVEITLSEINFKELINQTTGEFVERFKDKDLTLMTSVPEGRVYIVADGSRIWRVIENLYNNVAKYAQPGTRVYADLTIKGSMAELSVKNISAQALNIDADELTERFIRGDISRSTEGSGLGLSIARSLTTLQGGTFDIYLDGDLFKVTVAFPIVNGKTEDKDD